jgi:hypothetical protein
MKKVLIGTFVGGIIIFLWQFLSWTAINLHMPAQQYTPKQEAILTVLRENLQEGGYFVPNVPANAGMEEYNQYLKTYEGKPWATIQYHKAMKNNMGMSMTRGLITNIVTVWLLCWIILRFANLSFKKVLTASLFTGLIVFLNAAYTNHIWYETFDLWAHLVDAVVSWGLCGLWLGWWLSRKAPQSTKAFSFEQDAVEV